MSARTPPPAKRPPKAATATDRVYDGIYRAIVEHRLAPGARLREEELAESFAAAIDAEHEHLETVRGWLRQAVLEEAA